MSNQIDYSDIAIARKAAEHQIHMADVAARDAARLCAGRLQISGVSHQTLEALKKELARYNLKTGEWKA